MQCEGGAIADNYGPASIQEPGHRGSSVYCPFLIYVPIIQQYRHVDQRIDFGSEAAATALAVYANDVPKEALQERLESCAKSRCIRDVAKFGIKALHTSHPDGQRGHSRT